MVRIKEQIASGLAAYPKAIRLIRANKLGKYLVLPVILNIIVVLALVFSGLGIGDWINGIIERHTENMNGWIQAAMVAIKIVLPIIFFIVFIFIGGTIVNVLMSPIYTMLSEKTETILTGKEFPFDAKQTVKDIWRALLIAIRNTAKQLLLTALCLLLNIIPVIGSLHLRALALFRQGKLQGDSQAEVPGHHERGRVFAAAVPVLRDVYRGLHRGRFGSRRDDFTTGTEGERLTPLL